MTARECSTLQNSVWSDIFFFFKLTTDSRTKCESGKMHVIFSLCKYMYLNRLRIDMFFEGADKSCGLGFKVLNVQQQGTLRQHFCFRLQHKVNRWICDGRVCANLWRCGPSERISLCGWWVEEDPADIYADHHTELEVPAAPALPWQDLKHKVASRHILEMILYAEIFHFRTT